MAKKNKRHILLGLGLDHSDGHKRVTKGENFLLVGGSQLTHEEMQEKAIKLNEELKRKHKTLDELEQKEFRDIAIKVGLQPAKLPHGNRRSSR